MMKRTIAAVLLALVLVVATPRPASAYPGAIILAAATAINAVSSVIAACYYRHGIAYCWNKWTRAEHEENKGQRRSGGGSW